MVESTAHSKGGTEGGKQHGARAAGAFNRVLGGVLVVLVQRQISHNMTCQHRLPQAAQTTAPITALKVDEWQPPLPPPRPTELPSHNTTHTHTHAHTERHTKATPNKHVTHLSMSGSPPSTSHTTNTPTHTHQSYTTHVTHLSMSGSPPSTSHRLMSPRLAVALVLPWSLFLKIQ